MLTRLLRLARARTVRAGFLLLAVLLAVVAVARERAAVADALARVDAVSVVCALLLSLANVVLTAASWRAVVADLGSPLPWRAAARVFFVGQLGRYVPGTVWQFLLQAELARDYHVPRRRTGSALVVALLVAMTTAGLLVTAVLPFGVQQMPPAGGERSPLRWAAALPWVAPVLVALLAPGVLNPLLQLLLRVARRPPLEQALSVRGIAAAAGWALASWIAVGLQVFVLAHAVGGETVGAPRLLALAVGGYALAWVVGFLVVFAPAGAGAREVALVALLATGLAGGGALVVALLSRVLLTVADLLLAGAALLTARAALARVRAGAGGD